jgi:hypothetical protein
MDIQANSPVVIPKPNSQKLILEFATRILTEHKKFSQYYNKMEAIDQAYARFQANKDPHTGEVTGQGIDAATTPVGVMNLPSTVPPVVISQVDSMVAYLSEVFLSGSPLFPIVSNPKNKDSAEQLETLIDDHATLGGYARQLLMFIRDGVKYNFSALEADWTSVSQYSIMNDLLMNSNQKGPKQKLDKSITKYTKLKRLDPYNTVYDHNVNPGDISAEGDYAGYVEVLSRTKTKRFLNRLAAEGKAFNVREALSSGDLSTSPESVANYRVHPTVSNYIDARRPLDGMNWYTYLTGQQESKDTIKTGNFEIFRFYARIMPSEFQIVGPEAKTPQIWKFVVVNNAVLVQAERIISAYDYIPILFGQPLEDGLGHQTQSIAESNIPFQSAATTLFNIRFNSARRAVSDRALYDADLISPADINAPVPAAKIPVKSNSLDGTRRIQDAYHQIPFDARGTEAAFQDGMSIVSFGKELSGLNNPMQGKFQKGNKSVKEWDDTMSGADARLRLPALTLEFQVFMPLKEILKLNIYQYGEDAEVVSQKDGSVKKVDIEKLKTQVLSFRVADGYTPKSKLAGTDSIMQLMQILGQSQLLQQRYGPMLPGMFAHLAQLLGVRGLEEYTPDAGQQESNMMQANQMQQGVHPQTGMPMNPADMAPMVQAAATAAAPPVGQTPTKQ